MKECYKHLLSHEDDAELLPYMEAAFDSMFRYISSRQDSFEKEDLLQEPIEDAIHAMFYSISTIKQASDIPQDYFIDSPSNCTTSEKIRNCRKLMYEVIRDIPWDKVAEIHSKYNISGIIRYVLKTYVHTFDSAQYFYPILSLKCVQKQDPISISYMISDTFTDFGWKASINATRNLVSLYFQNVKIYKEVRKFINNNLNRFLWCDRAYYYTYPDNYEVINRLMSFRSYDELYRRLACYDNIYKKDNPLYFAVDFSSDIPYEWQVATALSKTKYLKDVVTSEFVYFISTKKPESLVIFNEELQDKIMLPINELAKILDDFVYPYMVQYNMFKEEQNSII